MQSGDGIGYNSSQTNNHPNVAVGRGNIKQGGGNGRRYNSDR